MFTHGPGKAKIAAFKHSRKLCLPRFSNQGRKSITAPVLPLRLFAYKEAQNSPLAPQEAISGQKNLQF